VGIVDFFLALYPGSEHPTTFSGARDPASSRLARELFYNWSLHASVSTSCKTIASHFHSSNC
jgi:hypothetical protein